MLERIISGGQTGVDRAALDAAHACGMSTGGWCPKGRRAEDGAIAARYPLTETPSAAYAQRTAWNVRDSDATLVLHFSSDAGVSEGTTFTVDEAKQRGKPYLVVRLPAEPVDARDWLATQEIRTLNVAGPRASEAPGVYQTAFAFLEGMLSRVVS